PILDLIYCVFAILQAGKISFNLLIRLKVFFLAEWREYQNIKKIICWIVLLISYFTLTEFHPHTIVITSLFYI
ncbi:hypothetical protein, partial [Photorhabdus bodei]|uniref:hypothetical protein n=1 Tax=Photorhabdus bodei TaxID=2029681 RepID=UPI001E3078F8